MVLARPFLHWWARSCSTSSDAPVKRLCMDDAPVPYASSMEQAVVKRGSDLVIAVKGLSTTSGGRGATEAASLAHPS